MTYRSRVFIVGLTRTGSSFCVGGYDVDRKVGVRLGRHVNRANAYPLQSWWEIEYTQDQNARAPHTEDVTVVSKSPIDAVDDWTPTRIAESASHWEGGVEAVFNGKAKFTASKSLYIDAGAELTKSVGYWYTSVKLTLDDGRYVAPSGRRIKYAGVAQPLPTIDPGTLVRVSLARWWRPEGSDMDLRCYVQLSGWFTDDDGEIVQHPATEEGEYVTPRVRRLRRASARCRCGHPRSIHAPLGCDLPRCACTAFRDRVSG